MILIVDVSTSPFLTLKSIKKILKTLITRFRAHCKSRIILFKTPNLLHCKDTISKLGHNELLSEPEFLWEAICYGLNCDCPKFIW